MEQTQNPLQPPTTEASVNVPTTEPLPVATAKTAQKPLVIAGVIVLLVGTIGLFIYKNLQKPPKPVLVVQTQPTPTPTPTRIFSPLATQSAFLKLQSTVASLSAQLNNYVVDDPSLSPPVLDLPLGFAQ